MMMKKVLLTILAAVPLVFISCDSDEDTTAPIIEHVHADEEVAVGDDITIDADFTDNEALGQAKIDIHDIFDGHDHGKVQAKWSETRTVSLSGTDAEIEEVFTVPANTTAGPYHVVVQCIDAAGNNAEFKEVDFWVMSPAAATFSVTDPQDETDISVGDVIRLEGSVDDVVGIDEVLVRIYVIEDHDDGGHDDGDEHDHGEEVYESEEEVAGGTMFDLGMWEDISVDASWTDEDHADIIIEISAIDVDGHISKTEIELHMH